MALATDEAAEQSHTTGPSAQKEVVGDRRARERETWITQEVPIKILHEDVVESLHEPHCPDPDVYIILPNLMQLKSISDRFTKLASSDSKGRQSGIVIADPAASSAGATALSTNTAPKLELSANMHGKLHLAIATDDLRIASVWSGLVNPPLDPAHITQDQASQLPSERMREAGDDDEAGWAKVRIDGKDWGRVLSVGRLSPKVVACELTCSRGRRDLGVLGLSANTLRFYQRDGTGFICLLTRQLEWRRVMFDCKLFLVLFACHPEGMN
jgi:HUS1 checkpoint protein